MKKKAWLAMALAFGMVSAWAQTLWGGAPIGASVDEVRTLLPQVKDVPSDGQDAEGVTALLEIPRYEIAGQGFVVHFVFVKDRLDRVVLVASPGSAQLARGLTDELGDSLRKRYGLDVSTRSRRSEEREGSVDRMWLYRRMSVRLQLLDDHTVRLTYSAELPTPRGRF
jgi:hypothetical protein